MSKKIKKTNAARILDGLGINYEIKTYEVDENDLSAVHVAQISGLNIEMSFKLWWHAATKPELSWRLSAAATNST